MDLAPIISHYGLYAVFVGALLEGETLLLVAGYAAHRGYLPFDAVVAAAWAGAVSGDQFFFSLGRRYGTHLVARHSPLAVRIRRALGLVDHYSTQIVIAMRFVWGSRMALPIALGMGHISRVRFLLVDMLSALLWALLIAAAGYAFSALVAQHAAALHRYERWGVAAVVAAAALWHGLTWWRHRSGASR